ncbi:tRNA-binding protein [Nitratidesulfovibrio vulgaris]|uniref:Chaperone CsaA n=1 Tax=Nitratidesulfovibrio vulgaris (strain ATCC 29579 / DSM 644 / CCUG 34227 / NCIMB 8303 / VKM B-1760 / Hildenborough) TaxID=882 RepID=Q72G33_NITV2|nr:tRNA-binding protein [Nitratidesulfovibrio vulgaris]GEB81411.1 tRNA-binding protein [Desulfovibrio desulfuricans]HBW14889.1 tRNA-binding protein [Desulfovibrio sp.]AAS94512.1 chaperone CsaA [Nitratidesulfovibrio vulgaris str. Hildenborough]ADP85226.1 export-related chaperone CsaA [Nitratidesulfovibrio vulgaris RCH1]WCB46779.1 tRNA-binding protein [Nitratidesulfovibrio vulgaris]
MSGEQEVASPPDTRRTITWDDFEAVEIRAGTVVRVEPFPEARIPAWKVWVDFGNELGVLKSSARITHLYAAEDLMGRQVVGVVNFPPRQIGPFRSEFLVTGFVQADGSVVLAVPERPVANGVRLA